MKSSPSTTARTPVRAIALALAAALAAISPTASAAPICARNPVLTLLATDTHDQESLFALSSDGDEGGSRLLVLNSRSERARLFSDSLAGLRSGGSHGPGAFLSTTSCGDDCFQPVQWQAGGWAPLGEPVGFSEASTVHMTYDSGGTPWLVFHRLADRPGATAAAAFRLEKQRWISRGRLYVQAVGAPGASPDPAADDAVLSGSGRFSASARPNYWLPALPTLPGSSGGQVVALDDAVVYLSFDGRLLMSSDGGNRWRKNTWAPWAARKAPEPWQAAEDYRLDLPAAPHADSLMTVWYDQRRRELPFLHLTTWHSSNGWKKAAVIDLASTLGRQIEHVLATSAGKWLLVGRCQARGVDSIIDALIVDPDATVVRAIEIPLEADPADLRPGA